MSAGSRMSSAGGKEKKIHQKKLRVFYLCRRLIHSPVSSCSASSPSTTNLWMQLNLLNWPVLDRLSLDFQKSFHLFHRNFLLINFPDFPHNYPTLDNKIIFFFLFQRYRKWKEDNKLAKQFSLKVLKQQMESFSP